VLYLGIELKSGGDPAKMTSCGVTTYDLGKSGPVGRPAMLTNLSASAGTLPGTALLHWSAEHGSHSYIVQQTTTPTDEASWKAAGTATKSSFTVPGLTSGTKYFFRVAALGTAGQGAFSDMAAQLAP